MYANAIPRKIPQTLVYGIRQARAAFEQVPEQVHQAVSNDSSNNNNNSNAASVITSRRMTSFVQSACPRHLASTTIANIAQEYAELIGVERMKEITHRQIEEVGLPDAIVNWGLLTQEDLGITEQDDMTIVLSQFNSERVTASQLRVNSSSSGSSVTRQQMNLDDSYSSVDFNSDPEKFEDITDTHPTVIQIKDSAKSLSNLLQSFRSWVVSLLDKCAAWARSLLKDYSSSTSSYAPTYSDKRTIEYSFYGVFFAAAFSVDIVLLERFRSPILTNAFRQAVLQMTLEFDFDQRQY